MPPALYRQALPALFLIAVAAGVPAWTQTAPAPRAAPAAPLASQFRVEKVVAGRDSGESLEEASAATVGDVIQYSATHRNVSSRVLLDVDFGIPIPFGTAYVEGSAQPEGARRVRLDKEREQMVWRVPRMAPGDTASFRLRVRIEPDPMLAPVPAAPRKPEIRRAPG
jgi:uncharacterized repeat protein (TIGR01451 family)